MVDKPHVTLLYHFFHPDDVVSARQFSDLAVGLVERGWDVTARPSNRLWSGGRARLARREPWRGVDIRRVWRPALRQASHVGRVVNAAWMLAAWKWAAIWSRRRPVDVVIVGSDPVLAATVAQPWRWFRRRSHVIHWCFDLYPDAAVAEGLLRPQSMGARVLGRLMAAAYRHCAFVADIGPCMARRIQAQAPGTRCITLTPWALVEPPALQAPDLAIRRELFGEAALALLYSGSFGRAHSHAEFLELARRMRSDSAAFCFAGRGHCMEELRRSATAEDTNIRFAGFAPEAGLEQRLAACDVQLVSLRPEWTGTVVPSKFFGALAAGRAVVFAGSPESGIAQWIREHRVGWVLTPETVESVAADLRALAARPEELGPLRDRCRAVYHEHFSKRRVLDRWDAELRALAGLPAGAGSSELPSNDPPAERPAFAAPTPVAELAASDARARHV